MRYAGLTSERRATVRFTGEIMWGAKWRRDDDEPVSVVPAGPVDRVVVVFVGQQLRREGVQSKIMCNCSIYQIIIYSFRTSGGGEGEQGKRLRR